MALDIKDEQQFTQEVLQSDKPVMVDFYAPWCGPCQQVAPHVEELSNELIQYKFVKVNIQDLDALAKQYSVTSIPTFAFFKKGTLIGKTTGYMSKDSIAEKLSEFLG